MQQPSRIELPAAAAGPHVLYTSGYETSLFPIPRIDIDHGASCGASCLPLCCVLVLPVQPARTPGHLARNG